MNEQEGKELLKKYLQGNCSAEEKAMLESWYWQYTRKDLPQIADTAKATQLNRIREQLVAHIGNEQRKTHLLWKKLSVAASILILLSIGVYFGLRKSSTREIASVKPGVFKNDVKPGNNNAILTLAGGKQIILKDAKNGLLAKQGASQVQKTAEGELKYEAASASQVEAVTYNTITTKRGNKYDVTLPDGTIAYLDAASSIHFPTAFAGNNREVSITGQVYFEVAHDKHKPFRVTAKGETVEVLGTHFNINAYDDEASIKTTLLEGSVKINENGQNAILVPGQQAQVTASKIAITRPDVEEVMAWKNGLFQFNNTDLQTAMRQLSRWYDVDVVYRGTAKNYRFGGFISRDSKLSDVLRILQLSGVNFSIDGNKLIVYE